MQDLVKQFATELAQALPILEPVVEIGSRPAEGQEELADLRPLFPGKEFIGCDIQPGTGVDRIEDIHALTFEDESVGTVLALDTLEHVADPIRAVAEIERILKPGGIAAITSHMFMPIHAHPWDYWRFTPEGFGLLLKPFKTSLVFANGWELMPNVVFGIGVKGDLDGLDLDLFPKTARQIRNWGKHLPVDLGPIRLSARQLWPLTYQATVAAVRKRLPGGDKRTP